MDFKGLFFSAEGRLNRLSYFLLWLSVKVISVILSVIFSTILQGNLIVNYVINGVINIATLVINVFLAIKRFHDFDKSGYYLLGFIVVTNISAAVLAGIIMMIAGEGAGLAALSLMALAILLYTFLKPGTDGVNQYGNQPTALFDLGLNDNVKNINPVISDNSNNL